MSLMGLVRSLAFLAIAWVIAALGMGVLKTGVNSGGEEGTFFIAKPALHDAVAADWTTGKDPFLFDQVTGQTRELDVPGDDRWTLLSIVPWRDSQGRLEAIGRWVNPEKTGFAGLGRFRLDDKKILDHVPLDILPIGRMCWVPDQPGAIVFPAGDGRLYRYQFVSQGDENEAGDRKGTKEAHVQAEMPVPLMWRDPEPGEGNVFLSDPVWSSDSRLQKFIFVALSRKVSTGTRKAYEYQSLWWLEVNALGDQIVAAGPLTHPNEKTDKAERTIERMPNIAVDSNGTMTLVYLVHFADKRATELRAVELDIDRQTGNPRIRTNRQGESSRALADGIPPAPLVVSADGKSVFAGGRGKSVRYSLSPER
jgi:hypothetical protein